MKFNKTYCTCAALIFLFFVNCPVAASGMPGARILEIHEKQKVYPLGMYLEILPDHEKKLSIEKVRTPLYAKQFEPSNSEAPNFGFNDSDFWVRLRVNNTMNRDLSWFLELGYPHMDVFKVFMKDQEGHYTERTTGDRFNFNMRELPYRNFVFNLFLEQGSINDIYLYFSGSCSKDMKLVLYAPDAFSAKVIEEKYVLGIYYGIIIVMIMYNLFLFFFTRSVSYLLYVNYIFLYGLVQLSYNGLAFKYLWPLFPVWHNISLPFLIGLTTLAMGLFSRQFLATRANAPRIDTVIKVIFAAAVAVMVVALFGSFFGLYLFAIRLAMILMVLASLTFLVAGFVSMKQGYRPARFYITAWIAFLFGMVLIAMNKLSFIPSNFLTEYAIQIGSALEVTLLSIALADRINVMNEEKRLAQLEQMKAQEKYKVLVENTNDIIFTLNEKWDFINANKRAHAHFKILPEELPNVNFLDLIYETDDELQVAKKLVLEKLLIFREDKKPLNFNVQFRSSIKDEPVEMQVRLEYIIIEGRSEILGKASSVEEDGLIKYFEYEKQRFSIGNYLTTAEDISHCVTRNLQKYLEHREINLLRLALREMIITAIEHGNLEATYEDQTAALEKNSYFEFIAERRQLPPYADRRVQILYSIDSEKVVYRITDQGKGFNHVMYMESASEKANENMLSHGRGLVLSKNIFDVVQYNERGNQVLLVKNFPRNVPHALGL